MCFKIKNWFLVKSLSPKLIDQLGSTVRSYSYYIALIVKQFLILDLSISESLPRVTFLYQWLYSSKNLIQILITTP